MDRKHKTDREQLGVWQGEGGSRVEAIFTNAYGICVLENGRWQGMQLDVAVAQEMVNRLCGRVVWSE